MAWTAGKTGRGMRPWPWAPRTLYKASCRGGGTLYKAQLCTQHNTQGLGSDGQMRNGRSGDWESDKKGLTRVKGPAAICHFVFPMFRQHHFLQKVFPWWGRIGWAQNGIHKIHLYHTVHPHPQIWVCKFNKKRLTRARVRLPSVVPKLRPVIETRRNWPGPIRGVSPLELKLGPDKNPQGPQSVSRSYLANLKISFSCVTELKALFASWFITRIACVDLFCKSVVCYKCQVGVCAIILPKSMLQSQQKDNICPAPLQHTLSQDETFLVTSFSHGCCPGFGLGLGLGRGLWLPYAWHQDQRRPQWNLAWRHKLGGMW